MHRLLRLAFFASFAVAIVLLTPACGDEPRPESAETSTAQPAVQPVTQQIDGDTPAARSPSAPNPSEVDEEAAQALRTLARSLVEQAGESSVIEGRDGWLFLTAELRHVAAGRFWGERAAEVSRASRADWADPMPVVVDFHQQVERAGARLLFVPVPPKAVVYPDMLPESPFDAPPLASVDAAHAQFLDLLRDAGVDVLDLTPRFIAHRAATDDDPDRRLYCRTDTHWSPHACELTAGWIAERVAEQLGPDAFAHVQLREYRLDDRTLSITGDLTVMSETLSGRETLPAPRVLTPAGGSPESWRDSPVLTLGDSHLLVFHAGDDMHATGSGLADHLAHRLGFPSDIVGVRGSGASPSRIALFRRRDQLAGKKVVVWVLTAREYTQSTQGWRQVPIVPE